MRHWFLIGVALTAVACSDGQGAGTTSSGSGSGGSGAGGGSGATGGDSGGSGASGGSSTGSGGGGAGGSAGSSAAGAGSSQAGGAAGSSGSGGSSAGTSGGSSGEAGNGGTGGSGGDPTCAIGVSDGSPPGVLTLTGAVQDSHDPVIIRGENQFYSFSTGDNVLVKTSPDLLKWDWGGEVFDGTPPRPSWLSTQVPGVMNLWAPDISFFGGKYHLYYSVSTFGSNRSCIGHATRDSLDSGSFVDQGYVICSNIGTSDNWNAIDPNVVIDQDGTPWLSFGSFWSGIKLIKLDQNGERDGTELHSIAARPNNGGAIEAPFIVWRCGYYYLFVSWDKCCDGVNSTYKIRVGRSTSVTGPYTDREGTDLTQGGGTPVLEGGMRWRGPGHNAILFSDTNAYNVYHAYDANNAGKPTLRIAELVFDEEGWPISGGP
jgi:arabinan endo-1,5-alpha-L-arabinosidase